MDYELKINNRFYFTGQIFDNKNIYIDINYETLNDHYHSEITKEKAKEIIEFLTKFVEDRH